MSESTTSDPLRGETESASAVGTGENSSFQLTVEKLNGKNFREWAQSIKLIIDGKGKLGYLTAETTKPASTNTVSLQKWRSENSMVTAWLVNSMKPSIGKTYLFLPTAKDVWDAVKETYSDSENSSQIFEIKTKLWQTRQGERDVTEYYLEMTTLWQELDLSSEEEWECAGDRARFKKKLENERVFEFLAGLHRDLDDVRGRILGRKPLSSTREVFAEAHATFVCGKTGGGAAEKFKCETDVDICVGTLSKAAGCHGGFIACSKKWKLLIQSRGRSFIFSTSTLVPVVAAAHAAVSVAKEERWRRRAIWNRVRDFQALTGIPVTSPILSLVVGIEEKAIQASRHLLKLGFHITAIRPPTVPPNSCRLRINLRAVHTLDDLRKLTNALSHCVNFQEIEFLCTNLNSKL